MSKKLKQDVNIEYKNAKQFMRKNNEGFIAVDDLLVFETNKLKKLREEKAEQGKKRKVGRSEPPLFARGKNFIDGGPSIHQAEAFTCDCELCKRELRQVRAQG